MEHRSTQPITITGIGVIGPFGTTPDALWHAQGPQDGTFQPCSRFDNGLPAAEVRKIDLRALFKSGQLSRAPLVSQFALAATHLALDQAGLLTGRRGKSDDVGIVFGTSNGPGVATQQIYHDLLETGASGVKPRVFQESVFNAPASLVSIHFALSGPIQVMPGAGCSGAMALYQAQLMLAQPGMTAVIALCSEELCSAIQSGLRDMRWHAKFTHDGSLSPGGIMGEGAVALILEKASTAKARGAAALAELAGVGLNNDAAALAFPDAKGGGLVAAMETCLADAQAKLADVSLVLTGSSSTSVDDRLEAAALSRVFGNSMPPQGSAKRSVGFMGGAAAFIEVVLAIESLRRGKRPACSGADTDIKAAQITAVLCNAIGLNGLFGAILVRRAV